jgi:hypothetical protein
MLWPVRRPQSFQSGLTMIGYLVFIVAAIVSWMTWRESVRLGRLRRQMLDAASGVVTDVSETQLPTGFVKLTGTYRGAPVVLEPVVDTLSVRKLPVLWLMATVPAPVAVGGTFDLLMRASGTEVFSRYHQLAHSIDVPEGFPEWAGIRSDDPGGLPPFDVISRYLQRFRDGHGKELLITPKGLRMVVMVDQADRGGYLIFRDTRFETATVTAEFVRGILDDLHALRADLAEKQIEAPVTS